MSIRAGLRLRATLIDVIHPMKWHLNRRDWQAPRAADRRRLRSRAAGFESLESRHLLATLPFGAMPDDTGEFMLGDVHVTVVLMESDASLSPSDADTENWTAGAIAEVKSRIQEGVQWWSETLDRMDSVRDGLLNFTFDWTFADTPVATGYEPISRISNDFSLWIYDFLEPRGFAQTFNFSSDIRAFNNFQREQNDADWAFTIFVANDQNDLDDQFAEGGSFRKAFAFAGGQFMVVPASRPASTYAHETGHMFWAMDEYSTSGTSYTATRGYYNTQNTNAASNPGHQHVDSIMSAGAYLNGAYESFTSSQSSLEMIGWKDSDGDGIFDVLDVPFDLTGVGEYDAASGTYSFTGTSEVRTLLNKNPFGLGNDITINKVRRAEYQIDGGPWQAVASWENSYKVSLDLSFPVPDGDHEIRIRTLDTRTGVTSVEFIGTTSTPSTQTVPSGTGGFLYNDSNNNSTWDQGEMPLADWALELVDDQGQLIQLHDVVEPDALHGDVSQPAQGVTLTAIGIDVASPGQVLSLPSVLFPSSLDNVLFTGSKSLGTTVETWTDGSRQLRISFDTPQTVVNVKAFGSGGSSFGRLEAYNSQGELIGRFTTRQLGAGEAQLMSIARPQGDIAYVVAGGHVGTTVVLDVVEWGAKAVVTTDSNGAYVLPNLPAGSYNIVVLAPDSFLPTTDNGSETSFTLTAGESLSNVNFGFRFLGSAWQNVTNSLDTNGDGFVTPLDALIVINRLNSAIGSQLTPDRPEGEFYYDVNADINVTALDALIIINYLNSAAYLASLGGGEGEVAAPANASGFQATSDTTAPEGEDALLGPARTAEEYFARRPFHVLDMNTGVEPCMCGQCVGSAIESLVAEPPPAARAASNDSLGAVALGWTPLVSREDSLVSSDSQDDGLAPVPRVASEADRVVDALHRLTDIAHIRPLPGLLTATDESESEQSDESAELVDEQLASEPSDA